MSAQERWLPLFPLNTVLFPQSSMPLQIFEERYKRMVRDCQDGDSMFGIVLIKAGVEVGEPAIPHSIGTTARIVQVNHIDQGRLLISITGQQRFRIKQITQYRPYMAADVELLSDGADSWLPDTEKKAIQVALTEHYRLTIGLAGGWVREARAPSDPVALSYYIARVLQVKSRDKQALLEEPSAAKRLEIELDLLRREAEPLKRRVAQELLQKFSKH